MSLLDLFRTKKVKITLENFPDVMGRVNSEGLNVSLLDVEFPEEVEVTQKEDASWRATYQGYGVVTLWKGDGLIFDLERPDGTGSVGGYIFPNHELALLAGVGAVQKDIAGELRGSSPPLCGCVPYEKGDFDPPKEEPLDYYHPCF